MTERGVIRDGCRPRVGIGLGQDRVQTFPSFIGKKTERDRKKNGGKIRLGGEK